MPKRIAKHTESSPPSLSDSPLGSDDSANLLKRRQAAAYLAIAANTLAAWAVRGEGPPFVRIGVRAVRYRRSDLDDWLSGRVVHPSAAGSRTAHTQHRHFDSPGTTAVTADAPAKS